VSSVSDGEFLKAICRDSLDSFVAKAFSIVEPGEKYQHNWHIECINAHLQALHENKLPQGKKRLCINVPPRSLKSFSASISFPAWVMGRNPSEKFICTSHKGTLAKEMAQKSRILMESDWYTETFPNTGIDHRQNEKHNFWTTQRGFYYSSPILSVTGKGGSYVIIDDPVNPTEAMSPTVRTDTNDTISRTLPTRFNDLKNAKWLMIMQRLHEDDPTGHFVIGDDRWHMLKMPGENLTGKDIIYELNGKTWVYKAGELLFPDRLSREVLDGLRKDLLEYNYAGQVLQEPVPMGGGVFNPLWIQFYGEGGIKPTEMNVVILCDPSGGEEMNKKKRKMSDWTAFMVVGLGIDNNYYLLDAVRDRLNPTERVDTLFMLHRKWNQLCGKPPKVGYEKYGMMADTHYIREKQKLDAYNFGLIELGGNAPKEDRISRLVPDMQMARWYFPHKLFYVDGEGRKFDLVQEILQAEMPSFPRARFDDMLDALSRVYEPDLNLSFPKPKVGMVSKAMRPREAEQDWTDF
jgi:phage terminase large subunit-like protein